MADLWQQNAAQFRERWSQCGLPPGGIVLSAANSLAAAGLVLAVRRDPATPFSIPGLAPEDLGLCGDPEGDKVPYASPGGATVDYRRRRSRAGDAPGHGGLPGAGGRVEIFDKGSSHDGVCQK